MVTDLDRLNSASALVQEAINKLLVIGRITVFHIEINWEVKRVNDTDQLVPTIVVESDGKD